MTGITQSSTQISPTARTAGIIGALAIAAALVGNGLALLVGTLAGADMEVLQPGASEPVEVGIAMVATMTVGPLLLGTIALLVAARWGARAWPKVWQALAWLGLAIGILTVFMPFTVEAGTDTRLTLASMHVTTGVVWFVALRRTPAGALSS